MEQPLRDKETGKWIFPAMSEVSVANTKDIAISGHRGKIVHFVTALEYVTELIILEYFFPNDTAERHTFVYSVMSQESFGLSGVYLYRVITETDTLVSEGKFVIQK